MRISNEDFKMVQEIAGRDITTIEVVDVLNLEINRLGWKVGGELVTAPDGNSYYIPATEGYVKQLISTIQHDRWLRRMGWLA
jgi:hypothetical protein